MVKNPPAMQEMHCSVVKNPPAMQEIQVQSLGSGRFPGEGNGNPLQYSCLGNTMDRGIWRATVHRIAKESNMTCRLNNNNQNSKVQRVPQRQPIGPKNLGHKGRQKSPHVKEIKMKFQGGPVNGFPCTLSGRERVPVSKVFPGNLGMSIDQEQWQPTLVLLPGKPHGWRSLVGCSPWGR